MTVRRRGPLAGLVLSALAAAGEAPLEEYASVPPVRGRRTVGTEALRCAAATKSLEVPRLPVGTPCPLALLFWTKSRPHCENQ